MRGQPCGPCSGALLWTDDSVLCYPPQLTVQQDMSIDSSRVQPGSLAVVTGATGYVSSWVVYELLTRGVTVRASVRDPSNRDKTDHLRKLASEFPGALEIFAADLLDDGSFDDAVQDADIVVHTASPFIRGRVRNAQEQLVAPAIQGTRNVINAIERAPSVKRLVLTSSILAITGDNANIERVGGKFSEEHWDELCDIKHRPYVYAKTQAERQAWALHDGQSRWSMVTINPGFVIGPSKTTRVDSESISFMRDLLRGQYALGVPAYHVPVVDVRTVAVAHAEAALRSAANGRYLVVAEPIWMIEIANVLREHFGDRFKLPSREVSKALMYLVGPTFKFSWDYVRLNFNIEIAVDNSRSIAQLGVQYPPAATTIIEHAEQLIADGLI